MDARISVILCVILCQTFAAGYQDYMRIGDGCESDDDCSEIQNGVCNNVTEMCICREGHVSSANDTTCLKLAREIGEECEISEQCKDLSTAKCSGGKCVVAEAVDAVPVSNKSHSECIDDFECSSGQCQNGVCIEKPLDLNVIGRSCTEDKECHVPGSVCETGKCLCRDGFVPSQNLKSCLAKAEAFGDECIESIQCLALNGVCLNKVCSAKFTNFLKVDEGSEGKKFLLLGASCQTDEECSHVSHAKCKEKVCECPDDYVTSVFATSCLAKARNEGDPCEVDKQCENVKGTICSENKCVKLLAVGRSLENANGAPGVINHSSKSIMFPAILILLKICLT